jgi:hypothetical protein
VQKKVFPLGGGKKVYGRRLLPLSGGNIGREGSGSLPKVKDDRHVACVSCGEILCLLPGTRMEDARRKPAVAGKQRASIHATGAVNADETGWSRPISVACMPAWWTARLVASQGYTTAQNCATSVSHVVRTMWYPLDV